jgi:hypothetical protein
VVTANTESQLRTKTWAELAKWFRLCPLLTEFFVLTATTLARLNAAFGACKTLQGHVEHYQDAPALVMQTRKGLHPILGPRNRIDPPGLGVSRIASSSRIPEHYAFRWRRLSLRERRMRPHRPAFLIS